VTTPDQARAELLTTLVATGALTGDWRPSFEAVPRHLFIPETIWRVDRAAGARLMPLHRHSDPRLWLRLAYRDAPVDTQVDDGEPAPDGGWEVTSSASQPSVVAGMLTALTVEPGMRVLEIGTGTGWNAALLAHRVGAENVTTIEIDADVADQARKALASAGYGGVTVVTGDGDGGWVEGAPYDRVIATVGAATVPYRWVEQTTPDGRVMVPMTNTYRAPGVAVLRVRPDGSASGRFGGPATFMGLRSQRVARPTSWDGVGESGVESSTDIHPWHLTGDRNAAVAIGQHLGDGVHTHWQETGDTTGYLWLLHPASLSWAWLILDDEPAPFVVRQGGPRTVFNDVAAAYQRWREQGEPAVADWLLTVTPDGQKIKLR
jgi:protein-L-isoaspartate O-methyltransferase